MPAVSFATSDLCPHPRRVYAPSDACADLIGANVAALVAVTNVDVAGAKISFLSPSPLPLPGGARFLTGSIKWVSSG